MMIDLDQCIQSDRIFQSNHHHHHPSQHQNGISTAGSLPAQPPVHHHAAHPHHHLHPPHHLSSPPPPPPPPHHHSLSIQPHQQPPLHHAQLLSGHFASSRSPIHHLNHSHHQHHHSNQYQTTQLSNQSETLKPPLNHHDESIFLANQHPTNCYTNTNTNQYESCSILPNTKTKIKRNRSSSKDHQNRSGSLTNIQPAGNTRNSILPQTRDDSRIKTNSLVVANKSSLMKISTNHSHNNHSEKNSLNGVSHSGLQGSKSTTPIMTTADTLRRKKKSHLSRDELARVCQLGEVTFESYNNSTYMIAIRSKGDRKSLIGYRCDWNNCGYMNARVERMFGHIRSQHPDAPTVKKLTTTANCTSTTTTVTTSTSSILSSRHRSSSSLSTASSSSSSTGSCLQSPHAKDARIQQQASSTSATTTTCSITPSCNSPLLNALNGIATEVINTKQTTNNQSLLRTDDNENDVILFDKQEPEKKKCHLLELLNENPDDPVGADIISINDNNKDDNSAIMHQTTISNQLDTQTFAGTSSQCLDGSYHHKNNNNNNNGNDNESLIDHVETIAHHCQNEPLSSNVDLNTVDRNNNECAHETVDSSLVVNDHNRHHTVNESNSNSTNDNAVSILPVNNNNDQQVKVSTLSPDELDSLFIDVNNKSMPMTKRNESFILDEIKKEDALQPINTNTSSNCNGKLAESNPIINSISVPVSETENSHSQNDYNGFRQYNGYRYSSNDNNTNTNSSTNNNNSNDNSNSNTSNAGANDFVIETKSENSQSAASNTNDSSLLYENEAGFDLDASLNDASNSSNSGNGFGGLGSGNKKRKANNSKNYIGKQNLFQEFKSDDVAKIRDSENKYIIALQKDMKIVGYRCDWPECEFLTCRKYVMVNHINGKHTNQRPYSCDMCNFTFVKRYFLKAHMHKVHKRGMNEDKKDDDDLLKRELDSDDHFDGNLFDDTAPVLKKKFKLHSGYYQGEKCDPDGSHGSVFNGKQSLMNTGAQSNIYKHFKPVYDDYSNDPLQMNGSTNLYPDNDSYNGNYPINKCFSANTSQQFDQTNGSFDIGNSNSYDNGYPNQNGPNMYGTMSQHAIEPTNSSITSVNTMTSLLTPPLNNSQMVNGNYRRNSSNNQCYNNSNTLSDAYSFNDKTITGTHPQTYSGLVSNTGNNQFNMDEFLSPPSSISSSGSASYSSCYMPGPDSMQPVRVTTNTSRTSNSLANSSSFYLHTPSPSPSSLSHSPASTNSVPIFSQTNTNTESNYISGASKNIASAGQYPINFANTFNNSTDANYMDNCDQMKNNFYGNGGYGMAKFGLMANDTKTMEPIYPITNQSSMINHPPQQQYLNYDGGFNNDSFSGTATSLPPPPVSYGGNFDSYSQTGQQLMSGSSDIYSTNIINRNGFTNHSAAAAAIGSQDCWNPSTTW